ncbi:lipoprotein 17-related variable surface protein [[Mycoplasma] mobile]|uniref:Variable surface protein mvspL n=1 Tax=Mycoplasma mobile (strain ATCC 43663 / 163K / NCTC 11711) TaxID=267748 RepID=Q6KHV3_MYCM1|nr:lipoprotein 17-related variable surface protein [[Mycoplasma] mobile]AAT27824.1 variable surface protein mvspL [Mycoplasma mobile 163K]
MKLNHKKLLISLGTLTSVAVIPISIVACATNEQNEVNLDTILANISEIKLLENAEKQLPSKITNENLNQIIEPFKFENTDFDINLTISEANDLEGILKINLAINLKTKPKNVSNKNFTISGFKKISDILQGELAKINSESFLVKQGVNLRNIPIFTVDEITLKNSFILPIASLNSGVEFLFEPLEQIKGNEELGKLNLKVIAIYKRENLDAITLEKVITINGFSSIINDALDLVKELNPIQTSNFSSLLPSEIKDSDLNTYIETPLKIITGISYSINLKENSSNNKEGSLIVILNAISNNGFKNSKEIIVNFFQTSKGRIEQILETINSGHFKINNPKKIPSEINNENLGLEIDFSSFDVKLDNFKLSYSISELQIPNDKLGQLILKITGTLEDINFSKEITLSGFQTSDERIKQILDNINASNFLVKDYKQLASSILDSNLKQLIKFNINSSIQKVNIDYQLLQSNFYNDEKGTITLLLTGTLSTSIISKEITIRGFITAKEAFADALGLIKGKIDSNFFTPSRVNLTEINFKEMEIKLKDIGFNSAYEFGNINTNRVVVKSYQIITVNNEKFDSKTKNMKIIVNGTFDGIAITYERDLIGFSAIDESIINSLIIIEKIAQGQLEQESFANNTLENITSNSREDFNLINQGIVVKLGDAWERNVDGNIILVDGIPVLDSSLKARGLKYLSNTFRWVTSDSKIENGIIISQTLTISFHFDETIDSLDLGISNFTISKVISISSKEN